MTTKTRAPFQIMGILNITPDSFFDGGRYFAVDSPSRSLALAVKHAARLIEEGADILDVGGESTRPGAAPVSVEEEKWRVLPVIGALAREFPKIVISVDTRKSEVAEAALEAGATMINDVSGLTDDKMVQLLKRYPCEAVMMHMRGTPQTMQKNPVYDDVVYDLAHFFKTRLALLESCGIDRQRLIIDPGIGFGKTTAHNLSLLKRLSELTDLGQRLLIGVSRKSFIGKTLNLTEADRLEGSLAAAVIAFMHGAQILRVHDVQATVRAVSLAQAVRDAGAE